LDKVNISVFINQRSFALLTFISGIMGIPVNLSKFISYTGNLKSMKIVVLAVLFMVFSSVTLLAANDYQSTDSVQIQTGNQNAQEKIGYPVIGAANDTLFFIYEKIGSYKPEVRAENISSRILTLGEDDLLKFDSIKIFPHETNVDIILDETIIMSVSEDDAAANNTTMLALAQQYADIIKNALHEVKKEGSIIRLVTRIGLVILVLGGTWLIYFLIIQGFRKLQTFVHSKRDTWLKELSYKKYTFLTVEQELSGILFALKVLKWFMFLILLYFLLPLIFSIFPFTRGWANVLLNLIWSPFKSVWLAVWNYLPNLFTILVIFFMMRYFIRFVKYIFSEIKNQHLKLPGFYPEWALPTFGIVRFLLLAFMVILIFPYLPGSDSQIFKGVSVFLGILFSLGSSSAIANMVAGLVITYMRPFQIGDRVKIGGITGDVVEKTLLVTRLKTIKNEVITIPNSTILSGNTINYSSIAKKEGLILYTTVTIGYDVPWKDMHAALIEAANRTEFLLKEPKPFVLQTSLDDFYVSYQINAVTKIPKKQAIIYSLLHQNIQDVCNERGIEIMSPHYRAERDGNKSTIPEDYLPKGYKIPGFNFNITKNEG